MFKHPKPHNDPFPRSSRTDDIKERLRLKMKADQEREATERAAREADEARAVAEAEAKRAEEEQLARAAAEAKKAARPWHTARFSMPTKKEDERDQRDPREQRDQQVEAIELKPEAGEEEKETAKEEDVEKGLEAIYMDRKKGEVPDLSRLVRRRSAWWLWAIMGLAMVGILLSLAAWTGFFLARPFQEYRGGGLRMSITGPSEVSLGREETFVIAWSNEDQGPLQHAEVRLGLPHDFIITSFDPQPTDKDARRWDLGLVPVGTRSEIKVRGVFIGALGATSALQSVASFRPTGFTKDFEGLDTFPVIYKDTVLMGAIYAPPKVVAGDSVEVRYEVANRGAAAMEGLLAHIQYPAGFVPAALPGASLDLANREAFLPLPKLAPNASSSVVLPGTFVSGVSGDLTFVAEAGRRGADGVFLPAQRTETRIPVLAGDLTLNLVVNGSDTDRTILPGDPLRISIAYRNTSPESLKDVSLRLAFESEVNGASATGTTLLDWNRLEDVTQGVSSTKPRLQTIVYTKDRIPAFAELLPQAEGTIDLAIPTLAAVSGTHAASIRVSLEGSASLVGTAKVNRAVRSQPIVLRERSDIAAIAEARYFTEEGAPIGFGPLPPVVGKTTAYRITWRLEKTLHAVQDLTVTAVLPKIVAWSARTFPEAGDVTYDEATRTVTWKLNQMPEDVNALEASFEVQLTPEAVDAGRFAQLLGDTKLSAKDAVVNEAIARSRPALSTDLQSDEGARGKGVVKAE